MQQATYQLLYVSSGVDDLSYSDLDHILTSSRICNAQNDLTGMLIYREGFFVQLLEGNFENVKEAMSRIIKDKRHMNLRVVFEGEVEGSLFPNFPMAFIDFDLMAEKDQYLHKLFSDAMLFGVSSTRDILGFLKGLGDSPEFLQSQ